MSNSTRTAAWQWTVLAMLPALLLASVQAAWPWPFFSDDSFISLRFSERLLQGHGLTWTDGADGLPKYVEGYSNLLWVLLTAGVGAFGIELVTAARMLGATATLLSLWWLASALRPRDLRTAVLAALAPVLVASTQPVMIWTLAGLEGPLLMALLAWGFAGLVRRYGDNSESGHPQSGQWRRSTLLVTGVPFALACITRPDGPLWAATAGLGLALQSRGDSSGIASGLRHAFWFGLPSLLTTAAQLAFRLSYYGDYVPNTAHVKAEFDAAALAPGWLFVKNAMFAMPGLALTAAIAAMLMLLARRTRTFTLVLVLPMLAWFTYLIAIGGDHFPGLRLMHGALVPLALLAALGVRAVSWPNVRMTIAALAAIAAGWWNVDVARHDARSMEARAETWEWHAKALGLVLGRAFGEQQARIAVDAAGALPYYSKLPAIDMLGLCDRTIATTPSATWIDTMVPGIPKPPGHMRGNGDYVIAQQPDLMTFQHAPGLPLPVFVSACEFEADPRFFEHYRCILLDLGTLEIVPGVHQAHLAPLWVRSEGRAGIERSDDRIIVPAYLFGSFQGSGSAINRYQPPTGDPTIDGAIAARLAAIGKFWTERSPVVRPNADGALQLVLAAADTAALPLPPSVTNTLAKGRWQVRIEPATSGATLSVSSGGTYANGLLSTDGSTTLELRLTANEPRTANPVRIVLDRTP